MQNNKIHGKEITKFGVEMKKFDQYGIQTWRIKLAEDRRRRCKAIKFSQCIGSSTCSQLLWPTPIDIYNGF